MVFQNWILPLLIGLVATYLLMSILYYNSPEMRQRFSDLGALIQLESSRPYYYANWVPENQSVYNNVVRSYGMQPRDMMVGTRDMNQGYQMPYPINLSANPHVKINLKKKNNNNNNNNYFHL